MSIADVFRGAFFVVGETAWCVFWGSRRMHWAVWWVNAMTAASAVVAFAIVGVILGAGLGAIAALMCGTVVFHLVGGLMESRGLFKMESEFGLPGIRQSWRKWRDSRHNPAKAFPIETAEQKALGAQSGQRRRK